MSELPSWSNEYVHDIEKQLVMCEEKANVCARIWETLLSIFEKIQESKSDNENKMLTYERRWAATRALLSLGKKRTVIFINVMQQSFIEVVPSRFSIFPSTVIFYRDLFLSDEWEYWKPHEIIQ